MKVVKESLKQQVKLWLDDLASLQKRAQTAVREIASLCSESPPDDWSKAFSSKNVMSLVNTAQSIKELPKTKVKELRKLKKIYEELIASGIQASNLYKDAHNTNHHGQGQYLKIIHWASYVDGLLKDFTKELDKTYRIFNLTTNATKNTVEWYIERSRNLYDKGSYDHAIASLSKAIEIDPYDVTLYNDRGLTYFRKGEYDLAIHDYSKAIELDPKEQVYVNRAVTYGDKGQYDRAIADCTKAMELEPNDAWPFFIRGSCYHESGQYDLAIADYSKSIKLDPGYAAAYNSRGLTYYEKEKYDLAIADFTKAIKIDTDDVEPYYNRGVAYYYSSQYDLAMIDFAKVIQSSESPDLVAKAREYLDGIKK